MLILPLSGAIFTDDMASFPGAPQHIFVDDQALQSNRSSGMDPAGTDADLGAESIPESIGEPGAGIDECASRVHTATERGCGGFRLCDDGVGMVR